MTDIQATNFVASSLILFGLLFGLHTYANTPTQADLTTTQDDRRRQSDNTPLALPVSPTSSTALPSPTDGTVEINEQQLLATPDLLQRAMLSALLYNNADNVAFLLPLYKQQDPKRIDSELIVWATAVIDGKDSPPKAIKGYKKLLDKHPNHTIIAVRLGQAYLANRQYTEALRVFKTQEPALSEQLLPYITYIEQIQKPQVSLSGNFLSDKNINNAPNNTTLGGGWRASPPESATGVLANINASKRFLFDDGQFLAPELNVNGKYYWNAKHYNEMVSRASLGIGKQDNTHQFVISPFFEHTAYAGGKKDQAKFSSFSWATGIGFETRSPIKQYTLSVNGEIAKNSYTTRKHLDGYAVNISPTLSYTPSWFDNGVVGIGGDVGYVHTQDKDDSYRRMGVRFLASKQWQNVGVRGNIGIAKRDYLAPMPIFNKTQNNTEYNASLSIWHNGLTYKNIVPRLTWQYQKTDSTIGLYNYDKNRLFVELGTRF